MRTGQKGCRSDEAKVPAKAQENQSDVEVLKLNSGKADNTGTGQDSQTQTHDLFNAKARDQVAGKERRNKHRQNVQRDNVCCVGLVKAAANHGQGRGRHHKVHQGIGHHRTDDSDSDGWRFQKLHPRPALGGVLGRHRRFRDVEEEE